MIGKFLSLSPLPAVSLDLSGANLKGASGSRGGRSSDCFESASAGLEEKQPGSSLEMPQHCGDPAQHAELCPGAAEQAGVLWGS